MVVLRNNPTVVSFAVLYIGSAPPLETTEGLESIQGPLRERYSANKEADIEGIDATLSVSPGFIQMQYTSDPGQAIQFPIGSVTICAAVRCVTTMNGATGESVSKFVSLNNPLAGGPNAKRPALFAVITRRTQGRKILECHAFICPSPKVAIDLVKCTSTAARNIKLTGTIKPEIKTGTLIANVEPRFTDDAKWNFNRESVVENNTRYSLNRNSDAPSLTTTEMHLIPGEPVGPSITAGPEFFEPVSTQGYFYSSDKAEVKKFNIEKTVGEIYPPVRPDQDGELYTQHSQRPITMPPLRRIGTGGPVLRPSNEFIRRINVTKPMLVGPRPLVRPRFFSPPPGMHRQRMYMPMGGPPPMFAPPVYMRRPKPRSYSGSRSHSGDRSKGSQPRSLKDNQNGNTDIKTPYGDADTSSDDGNARPNTPPTDYENRRGQRMSRRDQFDVRYREKSPRAFPPPPDAHLSPYGYDYNIYPPYNGGYPPFAIYNPHVRARSVPPHYRHRSKSQAKKEKKHKKSKKNNPKKRALKRYPIYQASSDISTEDFADYHSETQFAGSPYQLYPPRDFRRNENQFINEREFSKSIHEENRGTSGEPTTYPTVYQLNEEANKHGPSSKIEEDADFAMY